MKQSNVNAKRLLSISFMFAAVATLMFAGMDLAYAAPGPAHTANPPTLQVVVNTEGQMRITSGAITNTNGGEIAIYSDETTVLTPINGCNLPGPPSGLKYQLIDNMGALVGYSMPNQGDIIQLPWGQMKFIQAIDVSNQGTTGALVIANDYPLHWEEVNDGNTATADDDSNVTPLPDTYLFASCGTEGGINQPYQDSGLFTIVKPVGGSIIPIDSTSLVLAGIMSSSMLMLPVIGIAAGTAFAAYKLHKKLA